MEYSNILFRFIQPNSENPKKDHILSIKREEDGYLWSYCEEKRKRRQQMSLRDANAVLGNLQRMFHLLSWDTDPYDLIQVIAPGYPMVMLALADLKDSWPSLREFLEGVFENWPVNNFEEEEEAEEAEDSEVAQPFCGYGCECDCAAEDADNADDADLETDEDDRTDPDMPALVSQEDAHIADILLQILREPAPTTPPVVRKRLEPEFVSQDESPGQGWVEEAERREPIEIRRVVNTPNGPRTYIRFV